MTYNPWNVTDHPSPKRGQRSWQPPRYQAEVNEVLTAVPTHDLAAQPVAPTKHNVLETLRTARTDLRAAMTALSGLSSPSHSRAIDATMHFVDHLVGDLIRFVASTLPAHEVYEIGDQE